jgi:Protein of unknown function (DUF2742)
VLPGGADAQAPGHRGGNNAPAPSSRKRTASARRAAATANHTASKAVSWWSVHEWVAPLLDNLDWWPLVGTPEWVALPDRHPAKIAAVYDAARHWALRVETGQEAVAEASQAISAAVDWEALAGRMRRGRGAYIPREVAP